MSNRQCTITHPTDSKDTPNFQIVDSPIPAEVAADEVLLKVLVSGVRTGMLQECTYMRY